MDDATERADVLDDAGIIEAGADAYTCAACGGSIETIIWVGHAPLSELASRHE
jgi:hypothetical protein